MRVAIMSLCVSVSRGFSTEGNLMTEELGELYGEIVINMVTEPATQTRHRGHVSSYWVNIEQLLFPA